MGGLLASTRSDQSHDLIACRFAQGGFKFPECVRNTKLLLIISYLSVSSVRAAPIILVEFDSPYVFAEIADDKVNGYYGMSLPKIGERPSLACEFFITSDLSKLHECSPVH